ncbi:MAG TPA: hypothetical protein VEF04_14155 [Blastocatellia bacterium]|nr:hypothetical protein [Blastocatellia bacterium]
MTCQNIQSAISETVYGGMKSPVFNDGIRRHLNDCHGCQQHASEMSQMASLIGSLPRVSAPADFDFKLRARIARAKSEQQQQAGWFSSLLGRSFSLAQAGMATAAIALIVGISTYSLLPKQTTTVDNGPEVAVATSQGKTIAASPSSNQNVPAPDVTSEAAPARFSSVISTRGSKAVITNAKHHAASEMPKAQPANISDANLVAKNTILIKGARDKGVQVIAVPEVQAVTYGAQTVSFRPSQTRLKSNDEVTAAVIF